MTDIDDRLRDYAQRWRTAQPPPPPLRPVPAARPKVRRRGHPKRLAMVAAAAAVAAGVVAVAASRHHGPTRVSTGGQAGVPVAKPPLVHGQLHATAQVDLTSGRADSIDWTFFAQYLPAKQPPGIGPGLCLGIAVRLGNSSECDDPTKMSSLTVGIGRLQGDPAVLLISGVTSARAASFSIDLGNVSLSTPALSNAALPGLRFYALQVPVGDYPNNGAVNVEAVAADGTPLLRNDPRRAPPLLPTLPPAPAGTSHGPQAIWPPARTSPTAASSATLLAQDFAARVLGITNPSVTAAPTSPDGYIASITIRLPATGKIIKGTAQLQADHTWALIELGDPSQLRGITMLPDGHLGPVMALIPPADATQADVTDNAADGTHHLHLTAAQLATKTLHLPTNAAVDSIIVVYRNTAGAPVGALAGSFA